MNNLESKQHFSLRKLSVGLASVMIGLSFFSAENKTVKADTVSDANSVKTETVIQKAPAKFESQTNLGTQANLQVDKTSANSDQTTVSTGESDKNNVTNNLAIQNNSDKTNTVDASPDTADSNANTEAEQHTQSPLKTKLNTLAIKTKTLNKNLVNANALTENKAETVTPDYTPAIDAWTGSVDSQGYYELTGYDASKDSNLQNNGIFSIPNAADFEKAGKSTNGHQVGITRYGIHTIFKTNADKIKDLHFSDTNNQKIEAIGSDWSYAFSLNSRSDGWKSSNIQTISGNGFDTSNVKIMHGMFEYNQISDLTPLSNWKVDNVTNMYDMFAHNQISDLTPISNWKVDNVTNMYGMFARNQINDLTPISNWVVDNVTNMYSMFNSNKLSDLTPISNWKVDNVTDMGFMFADNQISDLTPLSNWKVDNVTDMNNIFGDNQISDLAPISNWKVDNVTGMGFMFADNQISDLTPLSNWKVDNVTDMSYMFDSNPDKYADFSKWNFSKVRNGYLDNFIGDGSVTPVIFVKDQSMLDRLKPNIQVTAPALTIGTDSVTMPTFYIKSNTKSDHDVVLDKVNEQLASYQSTHPNSVITPVENLATLTPHDLANAKFTVSAVSKNVTVHFVDDTDSSISAPNDYTLQDQSIGSTLNSVTALSADTDLANYNIVDSTFTVPQTDTSTWTVHLTHKTQDVSDTDPKAEQTNTYKMTNYTSQHYQNGSYGTLGFDELLMPHWTLTMHRSAIKDLVTGKTTYGDWDSAKFRLVRTDPNGDTHEITSDSNGDFVDSTNVRVYPGSMYVAYDATRNDSSLPDITDITKYITITSNDTRLILDTTYQPITLTIKKGTYQDFPEFNIVLEYVQEEHSQTFQFYDDITMQNVGDPVKITGFAYNTPVPTNLKMPTNYALAANNYLPTEWTFDSSDLNSTYTIHLVHQTKTETDYNPAKRTITIHNPDGTISTYVQTIGYKRDKITDLVTNGVTYGTYALDDPTSFYTINGAIQQAKSYRQDGSKIYFASIKIPKIPGYKTVVDQTNGATIVSYRLLALPKQNLAGINHVTESKISNPVNVQSSAIITPELIQQDNLSYYTIKQDDLNIAVPKVNDYEFHLDKSLKNALAFTYTNGNNTYKFSLTLDQNGQLLLRVENKNVSKQYTVKDRADLLKLIKSIIK